MPVGGAVQPPRPKYAPDPDYSEEARKLKYVGVVAIAGVVGQGGTFGDLCLMEAAGKGLDEQALKAGKTKTWKFDPATKGDIPVATFIQVEVSFRLY